MAAAACVQSGGVGVIVVAAAYLLRASRLAQLFPSPATDVRRLQDSRARSKSMLGRSKLQKTPDVLAASMVSLMLEQERAVTGR